MVCIAILLSSPPSLTGSECTRNTYKKYMHKAHGIHVLYTLKQITSRGRHFIFLFSSPLFYSITFPLKISRD